MAAERAVVGHVHERVRGRLPTALPVIEATSHDLGHVLTCILDTATVPEDLLEQMAYLRAELHRVQAESRRSRSRLVVLGLSGPRGERGVGGL